LWNIAQFTGPLSSAKLISQDEANYVMERWVCPSHRNMNTCNTHQLVICVNIMILRLADMGQSSWMSINLSWPKNWALPSTISS
jgi:hypothetical protein